jgi:hypothetical protein
MDRRDLLKLLGTAALSDVRSESSQAAVSEAPPKLEALKTKSQNPNRFLAFRMLRIYFATILLFASLLRPVSLFAQAVSISEKVEWTCEERPPNPDQKLPNVLLQGDSITRIVLPK